VLKLRAAAWDDGYAAVEDGEALFIIRPPYRRENKYRVTTQDIERAISNHGFSAAEGAFEDWAALIEHLRRRFIEARERSGAPDGARIMRMVERAPEDVLNNLLAKVEREMFPAREWHGATLLLAHALRNPIVRRDPETMDRVASLLQRAEESRNQDALSRAGLTNSASRVADDFALVRDMYGEDALKLGSLVQQQGQVLCMGAGATTP
jgi:hypothetical protein